MFLWLKLRSFLGTQNLRTKILELKLNPRAVLSKNMRLPKLSSGLAKSCQEKGHLEELGMRDKKTYLEWDRCLRVVQAVGDGKKSSQTYKILSR